MISDETKAKWKKKFDYTMGAILDGYFIANDWELSFLKNISDKIDDLSFHQSKALNSIYNKVITQ